MKTMILVILTAAITNNYVLVKFLGICPFLGVSKKLDQATGMSLAVIFVEVLATAVTWPIYHFLLAGKVDFTYMETVVFILVIAALVQLVEIVLKRYVPALHKSLGVYLPLITTNCGVLGVTMNVISDGMNYGEALLTALGCGLGFFLAMVLFSGVRSRVAEAEPPKSFEGLPITLGSAGLQIINLFDTMIYMRRLTGALAWSSDAADTAKGIYNFCQTIFNLPCSLITPITISIIPTVTAALTKGNTAGARHTEESAVRTMSLIAMPCAVGLAVLSEPIIRLLARNYGPESVATAAPILAYLGIAVIFNSTVLLFNAIMQAHGDVTTPVVNMLIGGVVKVVVNYILVAIPSLNIIGAAIGTIVCYVTITVLDLIAMRRSVTTRPAIFRNVIRPAAAAGIMGAATFFAAALLRSFTDSNTVVCLGALIAAVVVYVIFVVVLRCITYEDCMLLPKGEKIAKILHIKQKT